MLVVKGFSKDPLGTCCAGYFWKCTINGILSFQELNLLEYIVGIKCNLNNIQGCTKTYGYITDCRWETKNTCELNKFSC